MRSAGVFVAAQSSRTPVLIAVVVLALGGIVILNRFQEMNTPGYQEKVQKEQEREAAKKAQEQAAKNPAQGGGGITERDPANDLATFGAEKVLGQPNGKPAVTLGWRWTPQVQADPRLVYGAVDALQKAAPSASIRVVNLDARPGAVPEGVTVGGNTVVPAGPDGRIVAEAVSAAVPSVLQSGAAGGAGASPAAAPSVAAPAPAPAAP